MNAAKKAGQHIPYTIGIPFLKNLSAYAREVPPDEKSAGKSAIACEAFDFGIWKGWGLMKAIAITEGLDRPLWEVRELPTPVHGPTELLIQVHASGMNRADLVLPKVHYMAKGVPAVIAGYEIAGIVVEVGSECSGFAVGDRIMSLARAAFAEQCVIDHHLAIHIPPELDFTKAAAIPSWFITAHNAVTAQGRLKAGEAVLIQGITSGVGIAAAQIARALGAGIVIGVSRSAEKFDKLESFGLDALIEAHDGWPDEVKALTGGKGVDLIIDMVGGGVLSGNLAAAGLKARIVAVGRLGGEKDELDIGQLAFKRITITGTTFRSRTTEEQAEIVQSFEKSILPMVLDGRVKPVIDCVIPFENAQQAMDHVGRNAHFGKTVLSIVT